MIRYLALGDSYTVGEGVGAADTWPAQLVRLLTAHGVEAELTDVIAVTGWTTDEVAAGIKARNPDRRHDLVSLLVGVNNQYRGRSVGNFRQEFADLVAQAVAFAGGEPGHLLVLSIPDWGVTPLAGTRDREAIAREIDAYNDAARAETLAAGARWVDVTADSRAHPADLVADGLHPDAAAYRRWAALALPQALAAVGTG